MREIIYKAVEAAIFDNTRVGMRISNVDSRLRGNDDRVIFNLETKSFRNRR